MKAVVRTVLAIGLLTLAGIGLVAEPETLTLWILLGMLVGGVTIGLGARRSGWTAFGTRSRTVVGIGAGAATVVGCLALVGAVDLLGGAAGAVLLSAALLAGCGGALYLRSVVRRGVGRRGARPPFGRLSTPDLCLAWRRSGPELRATAPGRRYDGLVTLRRILLDELERRDPAGFQRWLAAGGDPDRYLTPPVHED